MSLPIERIRNFTVIAHVDHGKTTLTDCFLRLTGLLSGSTDVRVLDSNPIEQERGITIKLAPVRMQYTPSHSSSDEPYILNLLDTPGHVDFGYEVSRSLAACEGAILIVDASQGIQAQTLSHFRTATELGLSIIPVVNKIDLPTADVESVVLQLMELCHVSEAEVLLVSAKTGKNAASVLDAVVAKVPPPTGSLTKPARALLITSYFDAHKGAIGLVRVIDGTFASNDKLQFIATNQVFTPLQIGTYQPQLQPVAQLSAGEVGFVATGLKDLRDLKVGDTLAKATESMLVEPLHGYREPTPMVFAEVYPIESADFSLLQDAMLKLALRDAAITYSGVHSSALGSGYRVGFLGLLHAEVVFERLVREFAVQVIATSPSVTYQVTLTDGTVTIVEGPSQFPDASLVQEVQEPMARVSLISPPEYVGECTQLIQEHRGVLLNTQPLVGGLLLDAHIPLSELILHFHDELKSRTSGFASMDYQLAGYQPASVVKVSILLNGEPVEALSFLCLTNQAEQLGRARVEKLKSVMSRQMFEVAIQAAIGGRIVARETIKPFRKDVTAKLYGGDRTRRMKLLAKQAKGKKKMKQVGSVELDQETFLRLLKQ